MIHFLKGTVYDKKKKTKERFSIICTERRPQLQKRSVWVRLRYKRTIPKPENNQKEKRREFEPERSFESKRSEEEEEEEESKSGSETREEKMLPTTSRSRSSSSSSRANPMFLQYFRRIVKVLLLINISSLSWIDLRFRSIFR